MMSDFKKKLAKWALEQIGAEEVEEVNEMSNNTVDPPDADPIDSTPRLDSCGICGGPKFKPPETGDLAMPVCKVCDRETPRTRNGKDQLQW
jgi:hypothetical protein